MGAQLHLLRHGVPEDSDEDETPCCPSCHNPLPPDQDDCPVCARRLHAAVHLDLAAAVALAQPTAGSCWAGFADAGVTAATLVPPYLTMPLMDNVLIPFQNSKPIDWPLVSRYLGGLFAAAGLAWVLGWLRTYILALVSGAHWPRFAHHPMSTCWELSREYFGGKRTGDLMARIGSETDRINVFLSLHLLDFATDVLMIVMTSAILFSINPWLAIVPWRALPFIAWLIHYVRDKLRTGFEKVDRVWAEVTNVLADTIPGIRVVKAFAREQREGRAFSRANHNLAINDRLNKTWSLFSPTVTLLTEVGLLVVWAFGIWQISRATSPSAC